MRFIVSKQKDMVVTINSVDDQTKYNVEEKKVEGYND